MKPKISTLHGWDMGLKKVAYITTILFRKTFLESSSWRKRYSNPWLHPNMTTNNRATCFGLQSTFSIRTPIHWIHPRSLTVRLWKLMFGVNDPASYWVLVSFQGRSVKLWEGSTSFPFPTTSPWLFPRFFGPRFHANQVPREQVPRGRLYLMKSTEPQKNNFSLYWLFHRDAYNG